MCWTVDGERERWFGIPTLLYSLHVEIDSPAVSQRRWSVDHENRSYRSCEHDCLRRRFCFRARHRGCGHPGDDDRQTDCVDFVFRRVHRTLVCRTICRSAVWAPPSRRRDSTLMSLRRPDPLQRLVGRPLLTKPGNKAPSRVVCWPDANSHSSLVSDRGSWKFPNGACVLAMRRPTVPHSDSEASRSGRRCG